MFQRTHNLILPWELCHATSTTVAHPTVAYTALQNAFYFLSALARLVQIFY